jgi:hypothetical protein
MSDVVIRFSPDVVTELDLSSPTPNRRFDYSACPIFDVDAFVDEDETLDMPARQ